jgi:glycosyltransferase involved in cell wall biosynthesis
MTTKISIIVPALDEEKSLQTAINDVTDQLIGRDDYEILIFNDGSTDSTGKIADELSAVNPNIKVIHHQMPQNLGSCFYEGVTLARGEYATMLPGDGETDPRTIKNLFNSIGSADIITTYTVNKEVRSWKRRLLSAVYTFLINLLFHLNLKYFNGPSIIKVELLKKLPTISPGFSYMSEILVRLIKGGYNYKEIEMYIKPAKERKSRAFRLKNFKQVGEAIIKLLIDVYLKRKTLYDV